VRFAILVPNHVYFAFMNQGVKIGIVECSAHDRVGHCNSSLPGRRCREEEKRFGTPLSERNTQPCVNERFLHTQVRPDSQSMYCVLSAVSAIRAVQKL